MTLESLLIREEDDYRQHVQEQLDAEGKVFDAWFRRANDADVIDRRSAVLAFSAGREHQNEVNRTEIAGLASECAELRREVLRLEKMAQS